MIETRHESLVMVVDDSPANLDLLGRLLRSDGYRVHAFPSGEMALAAVPLSRPDLILLDIRMPGMDGYATCSALKTNEATRNIPVIFLSALDETMDKVKGFLAGAADYLTKPFEAEEVLVRVKHQILLQRYQNTILEQKAALEQSNLQLKELHDLKSGLTAMLVHDIQSPLSAVGMVLDTIREEKEVPEDLLEVSKRALSHIQTILEDLLELTRSEKVDWEIKAAPLHLGEIVEKVRSGFLLRAKNRDIQLEVALPAGLPSFEGEQTLVTRLLDNLVGNAFKYTSPGGSIAIAAEDCHGDGLEAGLHWLAVSVRDAGRGIPAEKLPYIFDPFRQVLRDDVGFGLGLAIVQRIVAQHKGRITVQSQVGVGTEFRVFFPIP